MGLLIRLVIYEPDLAGRIVAWSVELSEQEITYEPRQAVKAQVTVDFTQGFGL